jgi:hypothetical protein
MTDAPPEQWFIFAAWTFAVHTAQDMLRAAPREPVQIEVEAWARAYGLVPHPPGAVPLLHPVDFDPVYAMSTDLTEPLILATVQSAKQAETVQVSHLLIDGRHRCYHAHVQGQPTLPAYLLTLAETLAIRSHARAPRR